MKIIYIISFPPAYEYNSHVEPDHRWINRNNEIIGVWREDWGHVFAKNVKRFFPEIEFEVWRPDYRAEKEYEHKFEDGVVHRSFPAQTATFWRGLKPEQHPTSKSLILKISKLIDDHKNKKDLVFHVPLDFSYLGHKILIKFHERIPFLHTSHLNPEILNGNLKTLNPLSFLHRFFIKCTYNKHKKMLKEIAVSKDRTDFFQRYTNANIYQLDFLNFDFEWESNKISKEEARRKLKLPIDKTIIFSSSRLVPEKQIDKLLQTLARLEKHDFICLISGAGEINYENYLKQLCINLNLHKKVIFTGFLDNDLIDYYCASDLFVSTSISEAGPVSVFKALSLNIPVISTNTGVAFNILEEYQAGLVIDKNDWGSWRSFLERFFKGEVVKTIDPIKLKKMYEFRKGISQLVSSYENSINNFYGKNSF